MRVRVRRAADAVEAWMVKGGGSKAVKSAALEAAHSSSRGSGPASAWECRAVQSRQARPAEVQELSWGTAKEDTLTMLRGCRMIVCSMCRHRRKVCHVPTATLFPLQHRAVTLTALRQIWLQAPSTCAEPPYRHSVAEAQYLVSAVIATEVRCESY